ncbi:hypothetical protein GKC30_03290 [Pseudodesulfovibrio sp. F-1]|uniref:Uncharacterized protein n=1 Tax=Pseudodesulfovibrio alkaliphilus TaxID=2661613 RepID=A0A7K1KKP6_9BACT|nr:hypothetical protein [Pseudodesulfovibrio alkaliphilus]MUM76654.1 hypothetical protein [Pseudodesulfovibrio alkaliphilus]
MMMQTRRSQLGWPGCQDRERFTWSRAMSLDLVYGLRDHVRVGSHVPGRLTLKIGLGVIADPRVIEYVRVNGFGPPAELSVPAVRRTRFNPLTRSMVMEYDRQIIEPELLHRLFVCEGEDEFGSVAASLAEACGVDIERFRC